MTNNNQQLITSVDGFNTYTYIQLARTSYHTQAQVNVNSKVNMRSES